MYTCGHGDTQHMLRLVVVQTLRWLKNNSEDVVLLVSRDGLSRQKSKQTFGFLTVEWLRRAR